MELRELWNILLRRKRVFFIVLAAFWVPILLGALISKPVYRASSKIWVETTSDPQAAFISALGLKTSGATTTASSSDDYETDIQLAQMLPVLNELVSTLDLKNSDGDALKATQLVKMVTLHKTFLPQPCVSVKQFEESSIIKIDAYSPDPEEAMRMSNSLASLYIQSRIARTRKDFADVRDLVRARMAEVTDAYYSRLTESLDYKLKEGIVSISDEITTLMNKVSTLESSFDENERSIEEIGKRAEMNSRKFAEVQVFRKEAQDYSQNDTVKNLKSKLSDLLLNIAIMEIEITPEHPDFVSLQKQLDSVKSMMVGEAEMMLGSERYGLDPIWSDLYSKEFSDNVDMEVALLKRRLLKKYIDEYKAKLMALPRKQLQLDIQSAEISIYQDNYSKLLSFLTKAEIAEKAALSNLAVVEEGEKPTAKYFPKLALMSIAGLILALCSALTAVYVIDYVDGTIQTPAELKRLGTMPYLGSLVCSKVLAHPVVMPHIDSASADGHSVENSIRAIRNAVEFGLGDRGPVALAVTSSVPGEGKSTLAANLAVLYGMEGTRTVFVDMNRSHPAVEEFFGGLLPAGSGGSAAGTAMKTSIATLDLLAVGGGGAAFAAQALRSMVEELKLKYERIVIDTPSILDMNDVVRLAPVADGLVHVVAAGRVPIGTHEHVQLQLERAGARVIGAVLSKAHKY